MVRLRIPRLCVACSRRVALRRVALRCILERPHDDQIKCMYYLTYYQLQLRDDHTLEN